MKLNIKEAETACLIAVIGE